MESSDAAVRLDIENGTHVAVDAETSYIRRHQSRSITDSNTTLPDEPLLSGGSNIAINTTQPVVTGVYGVNGNGKMTGVDDAAGVDLPSVPIRLVLVRAQVEATVGLKSGVVVYGVWYDKGKGVRCRQHFLHVI